MPVFDQFFESGSGEPDGNERNEKYDRHRRNLVPRGFQGDCGGDKTAEAGGDDPADKVGDHGDDLRDHPFPDAP